MFNYFTIRYNVKQEIAYQLTQIDYALDVWQNIADKNQAILSTIITEDELKEITFASARVLGRFTAKVVHQWLPAFTEWLCAVLVTMIDNCEGLEAVPGESTVLAPSVTPGTVQIPNEQQAVDIWREFIKQRDRVKSAIVGVIQEVAPIFELFQTFTVKG